MAPKPGSTAGSSPSSSSATNALKSFNLANDIVSIPPEDEIFKFDADANKAAVSAKAWANDPHYFKRCRISAVALIKMVIHARSGVPYEIMGLMQGKIMGNSMVIIDSFALPVQGTETRVNAADAANEFMVQYNEDSKKVDRKENIIGWYHSHPGYGCWLSGIDVSTQMSYQKFEDPFVAVVIDPNRTISAGRVDIGAFRTFPEGYTPPSSHSSSDEYQSIPLAKIEDFGVHANQYYNLDVQVFKSKLDDELLGKLWNKYWVDTLSRSTLISNRAYATSQLADLHQKLQKAQSSVPNTRAPVPVVKDKDGKDASTSQDADKKGAGKKEEKKEDSQLQKGVRDSAKIAAEAQHGLIAQVLKDILFSSRPGQADVNTLSNVVDAASTPMSVS